jgi:hypothetical protein
VAGKTGSIDPARGYAAAAEIGHRGAVRPGWNRIPELARYNRDSRSTDKSIRGPLMEKTIDLRLDWVRARLDGKRWSSNCKSADTAPHERAR